MKKMKKIVSILLTVIMAVTMSMTAFADEGEGTTETPTTYTITINNATDGHTYEAYQVFTGRLEENVLSDIEWGSGVKGDELLTALKAESAFEGCENAADVAKALEEFESDSTELDAFAAIVGNKLSTKKAESTESNGVYTISGLDAGYYLVKDREKVTGHDASTKFILKVINSVAVAPKSDVPTVEKKVKENEKYKTNNGYNDVADYNIGDHVPFRLTGTMPSKLDDYTTYKYVFHDELGTGLTYDENTVKVVLKNDTTESVVTNSFETKIDGQNLTVSCDDVKAITGVTKDSKIIVEYTATLNSNAEIGLPGNENSVYLEFSNNPNAGDEGETGKTPVDKVIVFTYELDVTKVDGAKTEQTKVLPGAEFKLAKGENWENAKGVIIEGGKVTGWAGTKDGGTTLTSDEDGKFVVSGLDDGIYWLKETKAPTGYNLLPTPVKLVIAATTANGDNWPDEVAGGNALTGLTITVGEAQDAQPQNGDLNDGKVSVEITNNQGATLPETGGVGTTMFYVIGIILVAAAGILLVVRKRMGSEK